MNGYQIADELDAIGAHCDPAEWADSPMANAAWLLRQLQGQLDDIQQIANSRESDYLKAVRLATLAGEEG